MNPAHFTPGKELRMGGVNYAALPAVNASLNAATGLLLVLGYTLIRQRAVTGHTMCMLAAATTSTLFLVSYIVYHLHHGATRFPGTGPIRAVYFTILVSHTLLAIVQIPLIGMTLFRALRSQFHRHVTIARITLPIWLYVSATGVIVYWMLYRITY